ncbi:MAG: phosphoribosylanthranilate isomerase [Cellvibrionaceae bacterium]|jgi:phosphoribosylanthranilate isomerase
MITTKKSLYPVIHVQNVGQALRNAQIAFEAECDGVFLINHENEDGIRDLNYSDLLEIHAAVAAQFPDWWIGVNCLDLAAADVFQHLHPTVNGVWVDNGEIDETKPEQQAAQKNLDAKSQSGWQGVYFGGVAFKYQRPLEKIEDAARAAAIAAGFIDVVTTSGPGTGETASIQKIKAMRKALGDKPLGLASGITPENIEQYLPWVDIFLVATGISHSFYELDAKKVRQLARIVHN